MGRQMFVEFSNVKIYDHPLSNSGVVTFIDRHTTRESDFNRCSSGMLTRVRIIVKSSLYRCIIWLKKLLMSCIGV